MNFLSWDCANKTLAYSLITFDCAQLCGPWETLYRRIADGEYPIDELREFLRLIDSVFDVKECAVVNLLGRSNIKDVGKVERAKLLKKWMNEHPDISKPPPGTIVVIEQQPSMRCTPSQVLENQLIYHYADYEIINISPQLKNKIALNNITYEDFLAEELHKKKVRRNALYSARKTHSKTSMLWYLQSVGKMHLLEGVPKSSYDDVADTILQVMAYLKFCR